MNEELSCILCGTQGSPIETLSDTFRDEDSGRYRVARCATCGHVQITPLPSIEEEAEYYARDMQPRHIFKDRDYHDTLKANARVETDRRLAWLERYVPREGDRKVLDVGSGYGFYVNALSERGYDAHGMEISDDRIELARDTMKGKFHHGEVNDDVIAEFAGSFDAVTSFHVIEHLRNPTDYVSRLLKLLRPGGWLLIEVPNLADEMTFEIPEYADHQWQICHLSYFDKPRFELMLGRAGAHAAVVEGVQRYDLRHLLQWTDHRAPKLALPVSPGRGPLHDRIDALYRRDREERLTCDTLIASIRAPS